MDTKILLKKYFGYDNFRKNQEKIIESVMENRDTLVLMPTGGGKSICYQIPAMAMEGTAVVVSPLISLMYDQVEALKANGIEAAALNSTNDSTLDTIIRRRCVSGEIKLLYISPERLMTEIPLLLAHIKVSLFAIDEAHCISQWGHDFRPEYSQLGIIHDSFPDTPIMALTATADKVTQNDIIKQLNLKEPNIFISSFDRPNLSLAVKRGYTAKDKIHFIINYIKAHPLDAGIIYCLSRKNTESVAQYLRKAGIMARPYHAGMPQSERDKTQEDFKQDNLRVVCATVAFGMGIDKSNVRWVIHYNLPKSIESFYQEIGRAGRDGAPADTILFYSVADLIQLRSFADESGQKDVVMMKLKRMQYYAESNVCRRRILLNYFGETTDHDCGNCDVCENPPQRFDGTRYVQMALSAIKRTNEQTRISTTIDILRGVASPTIRRDCYDHLPTFGVGKGVTAMDWNDYIMQMIQLGYLEIAYDQGYSLKITPAGQDVLYGRKAAQLCTISREQASKAKPKQKLHLEIPTFGETHQPQTNIMGDKHTHISGNNPAIEDKNLFEALRTLRKQLADKEGFPPYIVFSDKTLHAMALTKPTTLEALGNILGVGEFKKKKYGKPFVDLIASKV